MVEKRLNRVLKNASQVLFDDSSKYIIMSDCHRSNDSHSDDFSKNRNLYYTALCHYLKSGFTYIELGDGDELWENRKMEEIFSAHSDAFWLLSEFYKRNRLYMLFGNHDIVKKYPSFKNSLTTYDYRNTETEPFYRAVKFYESLILNYIPSNREFLLFHGHQADYLNGFFWRLARFLARYVWRTMENFGVPDPTSAAKNYKKRIKVEKRISDWANKRDLSVITGHTHRPFLPSDGKSRYYNDGCCVHPRCITGIEIENGQISLIKWCVKTTKGGCLCIGREVLEGPVSLRTDLPPELYKQNSIMEGEN